LLLLYALTAYAFVKPLATKRHSYSELKSVCKASIPFAFSEPENILGIQILLWRVIP
jgi:hypothetical protein